MEKIIKTEGMRCEHCSARVKKALEEMGLDATIDLTRGEVKVSGDTIDEKAVKDTIEDLGFLVIT